MNRQVQSKSGTYKTGKAVNKKQLTTGPTRGGNTQPKIGKEHMVGDSIDREIQNVDSNLFQSKNQGQSHQAQAKLARPTDTNLGQISGTNGNTPIRNNAATAGLGPDTIGQSSKTSRRQQNRQQMDTVAATIDDSEFYRSTNMVDNTKDTIVETNIKGVLESHMNSNVDHRPCKVPYQLYEKLPMQKEGIYMKDFKAQDLRMCKPHYGDANNPYENFIPQHPPATDDSLYRRDYTSKQMKNSGEPDIRDVVSSQHDFAKHLRAPKVNDTMYKVLYLLEIG